jgi:hypothetical protein
MGVGAAALPPHCGAGPAKSGAAAASALAVGPAGLQGEGVAQHNSHQPAAQTAPGQALHWGRTGCGGSLQQQVCMEQPGVQTVTANLPALCPT